jgi:threonine synthase
MYKNYGVLVDPHTAVGIGVTKKISPEENTVVLSTAHPSKFPDVVMKATGIKPELPENLKSILVKKEKYDRLPKDFEKVKKYIRERK